MCVHFFPFRVPLLHPPLNLREICIYSPTHDKRVRFLFGVFQIFFFRFYFPLYSFVPSLVLLAFQSISGGLVSLIYCHFLLVTGCTASSAEEKKNRPPNNNNNKKERKQRKGWWRHEGFSSADINNNIEAKIPDSDRWEIILSQWVSANKSACKWSGTRANSCSAPFFIAVEEREPPIFLILIYLFISILPRTQFFL